MDFQHSSSLDKMKLDDTEDHPKMQRIWELCRIGSFDMDSWNKIFANLSDQDLANVALVCKDFQTMAQDIVEQRYKTLPFEFSFNESGWKPVICRFRNVISAVTVYGPSADGPALKIQQEDFTYFERIMSGTLKDLTFYHVSTKEWKEIVIQKKFEKLEKLAFLMCDLVAQCPIIGRLSYWYPNLKFLALTHCNIGRSRFLEQSLPRMEKLSLSGIRAVDINFFLIFMVKNRQLRELLVDLNHFPIESNMSCMPIANELLPNLESMFWCCTTLTLLPEFRRNFDNVKDLCFNLQSLGKYKNELLKFIEYFPMVVELKVLHIYRNLMTNDDLIDLLTQSPTLKKLVFNSRSAEVEMKFGYDLHRRLCAATSNRSDIYVEFEFAWLTDAQKCYKMSKDWIKENGEIIVLGESLSG